VDEENGEGREVDVPPDAYYGSTLLHEALCYVMVVSFVIQGSK